MPGWLRAKLREQPENIIVVDWFIFARKQLSIDNLCKTDDLLMDAFTEMGHSVTDTFVTALTKMSTSREAMDNRLSETSKKFEERNTILTNQLNDFQKRKNQTQQPQRGSFSQLADKIEIPHQEIVAFSEAGSAVTIEDLEDLEPFSNGLSG